MKKETQGLGTIVVRVERRFQHPLLKQTTKRQKGGKNVERFAGHLVAGRLSDGTRILEPVAKPASFTQKEIHDTIRDVLSKDKQPSRYAD